MLQLFRQTVCEMNAEQESHGHCRSDVILRTPKGIRKKWWLRSILCLLAAALSACSSTPLRNACCAAPSVKRVVTSPPRKPVSPPCYEIGSARIFLTDVAPQPVVTIPVGTLITVTAPKWRSPFHDTVITISDPSVLHQQCTELLPDGGRVAVMKASVPGNTFLGATITPYTNAFMPAWGGHVVVVR